MDREDTFLFHVTNDDLFKLHLSFSWCIKAKIHIKGCFCLFRGCCKQNSIWNVRYCVSIIGEMTFGNYRTCFQSNWIQKSQIRQKTFEQRLSKSKFKNKFHFVSDTQLHPSSNPRETHLTDKHTKKKIDDPPKISKKLILINHLSSCQNLSLFRFFLSLFSFHSNPLTTTKKLTNITYPHKSY